MLKFSAYCSRKLATASSQRASYLDLVEDEADVSRQLRACQHVRGKPCQLSLSLCCIDMCRPASQDTLHTTHCRVWSSPLVTTKSCRTIRSSTIVNCSSSSVDCIHAICARSYNCRSISRAQNYPSN